MKDRLFWQVIGVGVVVGLFSIGYGLSKNSPMPSVPFSSTAYADETAQKTGVSDIKKMPELIFKPLNNAGLLTRAKVPGGWLVTCHSDNTIGITFYPDPKHEWNGGSMVDKPEIKASRDTDERMPPRIFPPKYIPAKAATKALDLYDADKDGKISGDELSKAPGLKASLKVMKTDKEKGVTAEQISTRIQKWLDSKIGRVSLSCQVLHNGQPLSGVTVKFVPEEFLNDAPMETATGITNQTGMAMLSVPTGDGPDAMPPGLPPGMYRVEITKDGEDIPAKYNTETILGQEVSIDNLDLQMGIKFNLKY